MYSKHIRKLVFSAMFCALVFTVTWIAVPAPFAGNINLGDSMLLLGAWMLGGPWSVVACAVGAALTDLLGAYAIYTPGTLIIKALMVLAAIGVKKVASRLPAVPRYVLSALTAEAVMVVGYYLYESLFLSYGFTAAALNIPFNLIQGSAAIVVACLLRGLFSKIHLPEGLE
ncbi:MAG: ECF transporter S component [Clostridia bacterium]|nr:ECF transporter S component [Clostridia bacterium]